MKTAFRRVMTLSGAVLKSQPVHSASTVTKSSKNRRTKKDSVKTLSSTLNSLNTAVLRTAVSVSVLTV